MSSEKLFYSYVDIAKTIVESGKPLRRGALDRITKNRKFQKGELRGLRIFVQHLNLLFCGVNKLTDQESNLFESEGTYFGPENKLAKFKKRLNKMPKK